MTYKVREAYDAWVDLISGAIAPVARPAEEADTLERKLAYALNCHSAENASNTPDFILAQYLLGCLAAWNAAVNERERWYGRGDTPAPLPAPEGPRAEGEP